MKTKITLLIGAVALVTLSFTFASVEPSKSTDTVQDLQSSNTSAPIGGIIVDEVVQ